MRHAFVPHNLDMSLFGDKADKIAMILNHFYRLRLYKNEYGYVRRKRDYTKSVALSMKHLKAIVGESATPLMDLICHSKRHSDNGTLPVEKVLVRVKPPVKGVRAAHYILAEPYRVKPVIHRLQRTSPTKFKHDKAKMEAVIAGWPENYQTVCGHIRKLSLDMNETQFRELVQRIRNDYIQADKSKYVNRKVAELTKRYPNMNEDTAKGKAIASWERGSAERIAKLDNEHYDSLLFIEDKFLEVEGEYEFPIYSLDTQGRLHYFLTNMSEELRSYIRLGGCKMVSYDLGTSQCVFVWVTLREYIQENEITLNEIKRLTNEIEETMKECGDGAVPGYVQEGFDRLRRKRNPKTLDVEMKQLGKLLSMDFYDDIMQTIDWKRIPNGTFDRKRFKTDILFSFLYGKKPSWNKAENGSERKTMMHYFLKKFPAVYCILWQMRQFTDICRSYHQMTENGVHPLEALKHVADTYKTAEFPKEMQRQEANMFFNVIIPQIKQPLVTIHDSIIVQAGKKCNVSNIIKQAFMDKYQIRVNVKCERWNK